jgi:hypothetical protein
MALLIGTPLFLVLGIGFGTVVQAEDLSIRSAVWRADKSLLRVRGDAEHEDESVRIRNAGTGESLGVARFRGEDRWVFRLRNPDAVPCRVEAISDGHSETRAVKNAPEDCVDQVAGSGDPDPDPDPPGPGPAPVPDLGALRVLAANDLGMHCADLDYQIFSILPPFSVVHAQIVEPGTGQGLPRLVGDDEVDVVYSAVSNPRDPAAANSLNSTSQNGPGVFKSNFWASPDGQFTYGGRGYGPLFPGLDKLGACDPTLGPCPNLLDSLEPLAPDVGLPVPDPAALPALVAGQQAMPGVNAPYVSNEPQPFDRYDTDLPFFADFPFGRVIPGVNWFAADGIPMLPVDDSGNPNAYPLMQVAAVPNGSAPHGGPPVNLDQALGTTDIVLPVASEADCQTCHADPTDAGNGAATEFASVDRYTDGTPWVIATAATAPGPEQLLNAAKLNILRLHDAKHGVDYTSSADGSVTPCVSGKEPSCLTERTPVQCSQCHYSPALDLAQVGPVDEPEQGERGRQQTRHISMSRAMHQHHGEFTELFPEMPAPDAPVRVADVDGSFANGILEETCYQCHPGKDTQCLRGAMYSGGVVCQDCHGNMEQVGNDFTGEFPNTPFPDGADLTLRVSWADEPKCQSCHIGDALTVSRMDTSDFVVDPDDGIRLLQAYRRSDAPNTDERLPFIEAPDSRFAENESLYRLSKGHGGVMCEGCHGSTHAIWPVQPAPDDADAPFLANDNVASLQLQGHTGTLTECTTCHAPTENGLPLGLGGPHGMHPIADFNGDDQRWNDKHKETLEKQGPAACQSCHGVDGTGTVLSRTAAPRRLECKEEGTLCGKDQDFIDVAKGTQIGCDSCHENELFHD